MRLTPILCKQHLGRMTKKHWHLQGKRLIKNTNAVKTVSDLGIPILDINHVVEDVQIKENVVEDESHKPLNLAQPLPKYDKSHPLYKDRFCYKHDEKTVLLKGLDQAKIVAKAVQVADGLPSILEKRKEQLNVSEMNKLVQKAILASHVFDAQQVKLPRLHDPERPAWNFPRVYGISDKRRNYLLTEKLTQLCNTTTFEGSSLFAINNSKCVVPIIKDGDLIQFELTLHYSLLSSVPHEKFSTSEEDALVSNIALPDISPLKHTITFEKTHFYEPKDIFPVSNVSKFCNLHTVVIHHNKSEIKNLYETPVQDTQILGRCLLYGFATAVSQARQLFREVDNELPFPISVQCIQTDGKTFDFLVFQLNTLDLNSNDGPKNMFWMLPRMDLFSRCAYIDGRPSLEGYNPDVFKYFMTFCNNL